MIWYMDVLSVAVHGAGLAVSGEQVVELGRAEE